MAKRVRFAQGRKYTSTACLQCRKRKRKCEGENCSSCARENVTCVVDSESDGRRRNNRRIQRAQDAFSAEVINTMRAASPVHAQELFAAIRRHVSPKKIQEIVDRKGRSQWRNRSTCGDTENWTHKGSEQRKSSNPAEVQQSLARELRINDMAWPIAAPSLPCRSAEQAPTVLLSEDDPSPKREKPAEPNLQQKQASCSSGGYDVRLRVAPSKVEQLLMVMLHFREAANLQIAHGASAELVLNLKGLELELLFRDRREFDSHTVATWACEFAKSWPALPPVTQVAVVYLAGTFMRWFISPCGETYLSMPAILRPPGSGPPIGDLEEMERKSYAANWIYEVTTESYILKWPHTVAACFEESISESGHATMKPGRGFTQHCDEVKNWVNTSLQL